MRLLGASVVALFAHLALPGCSSAGSATSPLCTTVSGSGVSTTCVFTSSPSGACPLLTTQGTCPTTSLLGCCSTTSTLGGESLTTGTCYYDATLGTQAQAACTGAWSTTPPSGAPATTPPPEASASSCYSGLSAAEPTRCVVDGDCLGGARCDTAISPPTCVLLYCLPATAPCSDAVNCQQGMQCYAGKCNACNTCGHLCAVDFSSDPANCGSCGVSVDLGQDCVNGTPKCNPETPLECGNACVDPTTDPVNCGGCGKAVGAGQQCDNGAITCQSGNTQCGSACADLQSDESHCGSCGHACTRGLGCMNGSCSGSIDASTPTTCAAACTAIGATCTDGGVARYQGMYGDNTDGVDCTTVPPGNWSWDTGMMNCIENMGMQFCSNAMDFGPITSFSCDCQGS